MPRLRRSEVLERVFLVESSDRHELAATFLRFQEHYESPRFRRRVFSLEQFVDWSVRASGGFTYYRDWSGFNVPSWALEPFRDGRFDPLMERERRLLELFEDEREPFYVLGAVGAGAPMERATLEHELAHGLYATRPDYRREVRAVLESYDARALERHLHGLGYCRQVVPDEIHAYVLSERPVWERDPARLVALRRRLKRVFREHGGRDALEAVLARARRRGR